MTAITKGLVAVSLIILLISCAKKPVYIKDSIKYCVTEGAFTGKSWEYYERGISCSQGGFYLESINAFQTAIGGRKIDQWRARTFGMHFMDYFPHREMGVAYYHLEKYQDAINELEMSLSMAKSAKATYFLNKARKADLEQRKVDQSSPTVRISTPVDGTVTNQLNAKLSGIAEDDTFIASVTINGFPVWLELSKKRFNFEMEVDLKEGINEVKVIANDLVGRSTEKTLTIKVDRDGPLVTIDDVRDFNGNVKIAGQVADDAGIEYVDINGTEIVFRKSTELSFEREIGLPGQNRKIAITARDSAGNTTVAEFTLPPKLSASPAATVLASAAGWSGELNGLQRKNDTAFELIAQNASGRTDKISPDIKIKGVRDGQSVYAKEKKFTLSATDETGVTSLKINGKQFIKAAKVSPYLAISYLAKLVEGENKILIEVLDANGNKATKTITIVRKIQKIRQLSSRMIIALLPFDASERGSNTSIYINHILVQSIINQGRFRLVEREKLDQVIKELKLSQTELIDPATALKVSKILAAEFYLSGVVLEEKDSVSVIAKIFDVETSAIMSAKDVYVEEKKPPKIKQRIGDLAMKFKRDFPLLEGIITDIQGSKIVVNKGLNNNIKEGSKLLLFREEPAKKDATSGALLRPDFTVLGEAKVNVVYEEFSEAAIITNVGDIRSNDMMMTK